MMINNRLALTFVVSLTAFTIAISGVYAEEKAKRAERHRRVAERGGSVHIICHRGAVEFAHENTMEAYRAAFELGADGNEIDIRSTKDGVLVCFHDDMLDHLLKAYGDVADYTWDDLQRIPFRKPGRFGNHCRIPTLREVFELHRDYSGLMHLDVKRPGLVEPISSLLSELDLWDHVVQAPNDFADSRLENTRGKASLYSDRAEVDATAISAMLKKPGERIIVEYPQGVAMALGRTIGILTKTPVKGEIAFWAKSPLKPRDARNVSQLLDVLRDASDWNVVATGDDAEAKSADRILQRAIAADELTRRRVRTPEVFAALEDRIRHRSLHRSWRYCGLDGAAALRAMIALKAPLSVELARFCLWRDDPIIESARNPKYDNPRSWTDWRTKTIVFGALEALPGDATEQLCRDYLALSDDQAKTIGPLQFEPAAKTLLAICPEESTVKELLQHRLSTVRGRAILFCLANADKKWTKPIADRFMPK